MLVRKRLRITGRVQGVAFRASAVTAARALGLAGWVTNRADGSVEVVAEGDFGIPHAGPCPWSV
jgi:acylphosphatase